MQRQNEESHGDCKGQSMLVLAKCELEIGNSSKDYLVTLSVVSAQIFHERINKLKTSLWEKKGDLREDTELHEGGLLCPTWRWGFWSVSPR